MHWQQASFNFRNGIDTFPHEAIFAMGAFVRHDTETSVSVMYKANVAKQVRTIIEAAMNPKQDEAVPVLDETGSESDDATMQQAQEMANADQETDSSAEEAAAKENPVTPIQTEQQG